jgi:hypothetical protein
MVTQDTVDDRQDSLQDEAGLARGLSQNGDWVGTQFNERRICDLGDVLWHKIKKPRHYEVAGPDVQLFSLSS